MQLCDFRLFPKKVFVPYKAGIHFRFQQHVAAHSRTIFHACSLQTFPWSIVNDVPAAHSTTTLAVAPSTAVPCILSVVRCFRKERYCCWQYKSRVINVHTNAQIKRYTRPHIEQVTFKIQHQYEVFRKLLLFSTIHTFSKELHFLVTSPEASVRSSPSRYSCLGVSNDSFNLCHFKMNPFPYFLWDKLPVKDLPVNSTSTS